MLSTLHKRKQIELLGLSLVAGNDWLEQIEGDALKAIERVKLEGEVPVYRGANKPLLHSREFFEYQKKLYGIIYPGAWHRDKKVTIPPDGPPKHAKVEEEHAVNFIIRSVRKNPGEISILALGPLTNIALAIRQAPDIVSQIKSIIYMGGAFYEYGNSTTTAEFNWWFDAEAAAIVLAEPIHHIVIPLDATDRILFTKEHYKKWTSGKFARHFMSKYFLVPKFSKSFKDNPDYSIPVWDALVPAYLHDPSIATDKRQFYISVDSNRGPNYGNTIFSPLDIINYGAKRPHGSQPADVILRMDETRLWEIYEELVFSEDNF